MNNKEIFSVQIRAGKRTYFFDLKETSNEKRYVIIKESKKLENEGEFLRNQIMIFEEDIEAFGNCLNKIFLNFYKNKEIELSKMQKTKYQYKNAYKPWTQEEDEKLENLFCNGEKVSVISKYFDRNPGGIRSRIEKLELREKYPHLDT